MASSGDITVRTDVKYAQTDRPLLWDIYSPSSGGAHPVALVLHGGGLIAGDKSKVAQAAKTLARLGFVAIAPEYRLLGESPWPAQLDDVLTAMQAIQSGSQLLKIDPTKIFAIGFSAGAHLALLASVRAGRSKALGFAGIAAFFPPVVLDRTFAARLSIDEADLNELRPINIARELPPTILYCGDGDILTPGEMAMHLYVEMRRHDRVVDLRLYARLPHEFVSLPGMMDLTLRDAALFFKRNVLEKAAFDLQRQELNAFWDEVLASGRLGRALDEGKESPAAV